jgi:hypothetical protein
MFEEISMMVQAFQGLQTNSRLGKYKVSIHNENRANQACQMLHSMSICEPLAAINDTSTEARYSLVGYVVTFNVRSVRFNS